MIIDLLFDRYGQLRPGFTVSTQSSKSSQTYLGAEVIIQRRAAELFPAWVARMNIIDYLRDADDHRWLAAAECQYQLDLDNNCFWVQYQRSDQPDSPALIDYQQLTAAELQYQFQATLPAVIATESFLRQADIPDQLWADLYRQPAGKIHLARNISNQRLAQIFNYLQLPVAAPVFDEGPVVCSHGDALLKNIINTESGYRLIDWEGLGLYPTDFCLGHALSWILNKMTIARGRKFLDTVIADCQPLMAIENQQQARLAIYWQQLREALFWTADHQELQAAVYRAGMIWS